MNHSQRPTEQQYAALNALAKACNSELKQVDKQNLSLITSITDGFAEKAKLIGFSKTELIWRIGVINGNMTDRRV